MSEERQNMDDPIHRVFRRLRDGFSEIVVDLVGRVDERLQLFIEDERHRSPRWDKIISDVAKGAATILLSAQNAEDDDRSENPPLEDQAQTPNDAVDDEP